MKFDTSLTQLADTGARATTITEITGYSEGTTFDDVWSDSNGGLSGWWLQPPPDEWRTALEQVCHVMRGRLRRLAAAHAASPSAP